MKKFKEYFKYTNWWNVVAIFIGIEAFIGGYPTGLWDAVQGSISVAALVLIGRASLDRELEIALDKAKEAIAREKG